MSSVTEVMEVMERVDTNINGFLSHNPHHNTLSTLHHTIFSTPCFAFPHLMQSLISMPQVL